MKNKFYLKLKFFLTKKLKIDLLYISKLLMFEVAMKVVKEFAKTEIDDFKEQIDRFLSGEISEEKFKTIRLNHGVYSQRQPGFYMVRTKLPQGRVFDYQLELIADVAHQYGRDLAHLTTRQDIQIHWVELKDVADILMAYAEAGITTKEACGNTVRNITACPLAGICTKEIFDVSDIAYKTTMHFLRNPLCQNLPRKFKIAFSGCFDDCAYARINDIGFVAIEDKGIAGFKVYVGGGLGGHPRSAYLLKDFIKYNEAILYAEAVVRVFDKYGNRANRNMARLKYVFEGKGVERVKLLIEEEYKIIKSIYGDQELENLTQQELKLLSHLKNNEKISTSIRDTGQNSWYIHNLIKQKQDDYYAVIICIPFGDITSQQLKDVARLSRMYGSGEIRTSLDQNFILPWIHANDLYNIYDELLDINLIPSDNALTNIVSCPGAKTCNLGIARSQGLAQAIHDELNKEFKEEDLSNIKIRVCGCPNSCAQHYIANIGFSGMARHIGERYAPFYQLYLGGSGEQQSFAFAKPLLKVPAKNVPALTRNIIELYKSNRKPLESFNDWLIRYDEDKLIEELLVYSYLPEYERAPEYYSDYGTDEPFSIKEIGKGECAGGVVDTIEIYLNRAETKMIDADIFAHRGLSKQSLEQARAGFIYAIQALLITQGIDPDTLDLKELESYIGQLKANNIIDSTIYNIYYHLFAHEQGDDAEQMVKEVRRVIHTIRKWTESFDEALLSDKSIKDINKAEVKMAKEILDLKGVKCPYNYVKAKLKLEELNSGDEIEIYLDDGEPIANVPRSLADDGHTIISIDKLDDTHFKLLVKKGSS